MAVASLLMFSIGRIDNFLNNGANSAFKLENVIILIICFNF